MYMRSRGFTIVELMVGLTLGLILLAGLLIVFSNASRSFRKDENASRIHDELRLSMAIMAEDLEMAGFWSELHDPGRIDTTDATLALSNNTSCGAGTLTSAFVYTSLAQPIVFENNVATATPARFPFICDAVPNSDVIAIRRLSGTWSGRTLQADDPGTAAVEAAGTRQGATEAGNVYVRTNGTVGRIFIPVADNGAPATPVGNANPPAFVAHADWQYRLVVYYVRQCATLDGAGACADTTPTLCRKVLEFAGPPRINTECLSQGIETLQIEYGVDAAPIGVFPDPSGDRVPERYESDPDLATELPLVVAVRVSMVGRAQPGIRSYGGVSETRDHSYANAKTYTVADHTYTPADNFFRDVLTSTVLLRNSTSLRF